MNEWTLTYLFSCVLLGFGILRTRSPARRPRWPRLILWWLASALSALLVWSVTACTALPLLGVLGATGSFVDLGVCIVGAGFWASAVVVAALPFYGLLLTFYTLRFGLEQGGWPTIARNTFVLGLPPALVLLYGYGFPTHDGVVAAVLEALPYSLLGLVAGTAGLLVPRLLFRPLAPGGLLRANAS